jgi:hypothetical protein
LNQSQSIPTTVGGVTNGQRQEAYEGANVPM